MHITLFGATGRVGRRVLEYALAEGHAVRALARDPAKLPAHGLLATLRGDVLEPAAVASALEGAEAVLSTLGGAGLEDPGEAQSQGMRNIVAAMTPRGVKRLLAVGNSGILDSMHGGLRLDRPDFLAMFRPVTERHREAWEAMRASALDWTMVACPDIVPGERTRSYRTRADLMPEKGVRISVEDVADFLLREMMERRFVGTRVGLAY